MHQNEYKPHLDFSAEIEISEDKYWVVVTIEGTGIDCLWEQIPLPLRQRCPKPQTPVHIIRILAKNLVFAKLYKDYILCGLLKWQAEQNKEGNYDKEDFVH